MVLDTFKFKKPDCLNAWNKNESATLLVLNNFPGSVTIMWSYLLHKGFMILAGSFCRCCARAWGRCCFWLDICTWGRESLAPTIQAWYPNCSNQVHGVVGKEICRSLLLEVVTVWRSKFSCLSAISQDAYICFFWLHSAIFSLRMADGIRWWTRVTGKETGWRTPVAVCIQQLFARQWVKDCWMLPFWKKPRKAMRA